jgi:hypothetical protein
MRKKIVTAAKRFNQVLTDFVFDPASAVSSRSQLPQGLR